MQSKFGFRQLSRNVQLDLSCFPSGKRPWVRSHGDAQWAGDDLGKPEWVQDLPQCPPAQPHVGSSRASALPAHHSNF